MQDRRDDLNREFVRIEENQDDLAKQYAQSNDQQNWLSLLLTKHFKDMRSH